MNARSEAPVRVGLIGYGYWGPNLARNLRSVPGIELAALCDRDPAQRVAARHAYPWIEPCNDAQAVIESDAIDAVVIATPVHTHFALASAALAAGKHVLVEKPLAASSDEAERLTAQAGRERRVLMVDHPFVFAPAVQRTHAVIAEGTLGRLQYYDSVRANLGRFRADVDVLWDLAVHDVSILDYLLDEMPAEVSAVGTSCLSGAGADLAYLTLRYRSGLLAHVHANWLAPMKIRRTMLGGDRSMLVFDDLEASEKLKLYDHGVELQGSNASNGSNASRRGAPDAHEAEQRRIGYRTGDVWAPRLAVTEPLRAVCEAFRDAIVGRTPPLTDGACGVRVLRVLEAASRSLAARGAPMAIDAVASVVPPSTAPERVGAGTTEAND